MKIYIDSNNQDKMIPILMNLINERVDEEPIDLIVDTVLTDDTKKQISGLAPQTLTITTMQTSYISNMIDNAEYMRHIFILKADMWEEQIKMISEIEYYQGLPLIVDLDSFQALKDSDPANFSELFIDKLIMFYEELGLFRHNTLNLNMINKVDFDIYNTFTAFMSEEMQNLCFWFNVGWIPDTPELYGIDPTKVQCNMHCVDGGLIKDDGVYFCQYKMVKLAELSERSTPECRKKLFTYFKEHKCSGCSNR